MSDTSQFQSPASIQNSVNQGQVAPASVTQSPGSLPGAPQQGVVGQPAAPQQAGVATPPQGGPSAEEIQRQLDQERAQRLQYEQRLNQQQQVFTQLQQAANEQQRKQKFDQDMQIMLAAASNMTPEESNRYIAQQTQALIAERERAAQQEIQRVQQQAQAQLEWARAPQYADHLADQVGLSERGRERLKALEDPNLMYAMYKQIKADEDFYQSQISQIQQGQVQQARSQEVLAMQNAGLGAVGGQNTGTFQVEIPENLGPDERAMLIYNYQKYGPGYQPRP